MKDHECSVDQRVKITEGEGLGEIGTVVEIFETSFGKVHATVLIPEDPHGRAVNKRASDLELSTD